MKRFFICGGLFALLACFILGHLARQILRPTISPQTSTPKAQSKPLLSTLDSALQEGKLPIPRAYLDSKINGALSYSHAMQIARDYYQRMDYEGSLVWMYRAYELAPLDKEVWILYARNLFALGRKQEALAILEYAKRNLP